MIPPSPLLHTAIHPIDAFRRESARPQLQQQPLLIPANNGILVDNQLTSVMRNFQQQLAICPHSPGDPFMWTIHADLPSISRKLFGSPSAGMGILMSANSQSQISGILEPTGAFVQYLLKSQSEQIFFDINLDALPGPVRRLLDDYPSQSGGDLPLFIKNHLQFSPGGLTESGGGHKVKLRFTMAEYFLFYFVYFATFSSTGSAPSVAGGDGFQMDASSSNMRKVVSLLKLPGGSGAAASNPLLQSSFAPNYSGASNVHFSALGSGPSKPGAAYSQLFAVYLQFFLPWRAGVNNQPTIFDCPYIDVSTQLHLASFFQSAACELLLVQNDYPSIINSPQPVIPSTEQFQLVEMLQSHILAMDLTQCLASPPTRYSSFEDLSVWNPLEWLQSTSLRTFRVAFYKFMRVLLQRNQNVPFSSITRLLFAWLKPDLDSDYMRAYISDNLLFFTVVFDEYLGLLASKMPLNGVLIYLTRPTESQSILAEQNLRDLRELSELLNYSFRSNNIEWISMCENILCGNQQAFANAPSDYLEELGMFVQRIHDAYGAFESPIQMSYAPIFGSLNGSAARLVKRVNQLQVFLTHIASLSIKDLASPVASTTSAFNVSKWFDFSTNGTAKPLANITEQLEVVQKCCKATNAIFNNESDAIQIKQWMEEANQMVKEASIATKNNKQARGMAYLDPDSEIVTDAKQWGQSKKLTARGRQQILKGEQKCSNRDLEPPKWEPSDLRRFSSREFEFLARFLVSLGQLMNFYFPEAVDAINFKVGRTIIPNAAKALDFCWLRLLASWDNMILALLGWMILRILCWILAWLLF